MSEDVTPPKRKSEVIESKDLIKSVLFMKEKGLLKESISGIIFETVKEAEESKKEDIVSKINENLNNLKDDISSIQKDGTPLKLYSLKLLRIPMKTKVWMATYSTEELKNIFEVIEGIKIKIKPLKIALEKKEAES